MVYINKVQQIDDYIFIEYNTNSITISNRVYNHQDLSPQEIVQKGYNELKPHIDMECARLNIVPNHTIEDVFDKIISIEILGIETVNFIEGQQAIEKPLRCKGSTLFGKAINLTEEAVFTPSNPLIINPTKSENIEIKVVYEDLTADAAINVNYKSLVEIEVENAANLAKQEAEEKAKLIQEKKNRIEAIRQELSSTDYKVLKYTEGELTEEEFTIIKTDRSKLRVEYNTLELEITAQIL